MNVVNGNLLILASAGSGKTYQLGNRVIGKIGVGIDPEKIVALTFTRKAAGEFADSVLGKLSEVTLDEHRAKALRNEIGQPAADFAEILQTITRSLPKFTLTTIDSFFTRVVRGFQYELGLTGGRFDLLEGPRAAAAREELIAELLGNRIDEKSAADFARAFRRATVGKEGVSVRVGVGGYVSDWHRRFLSTSPLEWGPDFLLNTHPKEWEERKRDLSQAAIDACDGITDHRKGQADQVRNFITNVEAHIVSAKGFPSDGKVASAILEAVAANATGDIELQYHKPFTLPNAALVAISELVKLAAGAEMGAAVLRTRAIARVLEGYDRMADARFRRRGLLGFEDVKRLMGAWQRDEEDRLRRERIDFRLDARYEHWLLDEFQDTSRGEWLGLLPLLSEAVQSGGDGSLFIVGDRKQAIYGWRGGDVSLFDEVKQTFGNGIEERPMSESWRSSPEVLDLVNRICGDSLLIGEMFGISEDRWVWDDHHSAPKLCNPTFAGEACVELFDMLERAVNEDDEEAESSTSSDPRVARMIERMRQLGIGEKDLTCAVLVRRNKEGRKIADLLRVEGFDVVLDGVRHPAKDHPVGVVALQWIRWLANPGDTHAKRIIDMSPLRAYLNADGEGTEFDLWEGLLAEAQTHGFSKMLEKTFAPVLDESSAYGRRRFSEMVDALAAFDAEGNCDPNAAAERLERLEVPQNPGAATIQVMTIHKSKGLGFDVVFLPDIPDISIPETRRFQVAEGEGWITEVPPSWARKFFPEIRTCEEAWAKDQAYEALCQVYVALTRAKRGLYVYLGKSAKNPKTETSTMTNWILRALHDDVLFGTVFHAGNPDWAHDVPMKPETRRATTSIRLAAVGLCRKRMSLTASHPNPHETRLDRSRPAQVTGREFGAEVHHIFEQVGWIEDLDPASLPNGDAGDCVRSVLEHSEIGSVFRKPSGHVDLLREQAVDGIDKDAWISGIMDRVHLHREFESGPVTRVEIIDFKTDSGVDAGLLLHRHTPQIRGYARIMANVFPEAQIEPWILSTALRQIIPVEWM